MIAGLHYVTRRCTLPPNPCRRSLDLFDELDASYRRTADPRAWDWRGRTGWPMGATGYGLGGGVARIAFAGDTYEPSDREGVGTPAVIIPAWSGPAPSSPDSLVDLLAWIPASGALIPRLGTAAVLGEWAIRRAEEPDPFGLGRRLVIYPNVLEWARATADGAVWRHQRGGHGIVVLDWRRLRSEIWYLVDEGVEMVAPDLGTGRRLRAALEPPTPRKPRILIAEQPAEVAA